MMRLLALTPILIYFLCTSCEQPTSVGENLIPVDDQLELDSITYTDIITNTFRDDSIYTSFLTTMQLGKIVSPYFGESTASIYAEPLFTGGFADLENAVFDSVELYLKTLSFQGDTTIAQTIDIFELSEPIRSIDDGLYYEFEGLPYSNPLGQFNNVIYSSDSVSVGGIMTTSHIRTKLEDNFGNTLFQQLNDSTITNNLELLDVFAGIALVPNEMSASAGWFRINMSTSIPTLTGLLFHYHNSEDTVSYSIPFQIQQDFTDADGNEFAGAQNHNQIITNYATGDLEILQQLAVYNPIGNSSGYLQSGNGLYTELDFSGLLSQLTPTNNVNYAQLSIYPNILNPADSVYLPASLLLADGFVLNDENQKIGSIYGIDGTNRTGTLTNGRLYDTSYIATLDKDNDGNFVYNFFFPNTMQAMNREIIGSKLFLFPNTRSSSYKGLQFTSNNLELKLIYTKID